MRERFLIDINRVLIPDATGTCRLMKFFSNRYSSRSLPHELASGNRCDIYRRMRRGYLNPTVLFSAFVLAPLCVLATFFLIFMLDMFGYEDLTLLGRTLTLFTVYLVVSFTIIDLVGLPLVRKWYRKAYTEAMLDNRLCPWCGYGLKGLPTGADGNVMCPECTGKWAGPVDEADGSPGTS